MRIASVILSLLEEEAMRRVLMSVLTELNLQAKTSFLKGTNIRPSETTFWEK